MLCGCVTWTIAPDKFGTFREAHRGFLLRYLEKLTPSHSASVHYMLPYTRSSKTTGCERIEDTVMMRIFLHDGHLVCMHDETLPNIVMHGVVVVVICCI